MILTKLTLLIVNREWAVCIVSPFFRVDQCRVVFNYIFKMRISFNCSTLNLFLKKFLLRLDQFQKIKLIYKTTKNCNKTTKTQLILANFENECFCLRKPITAKEKFIGTIVLLFFRKLYSL